MAKNDYKIAEMARNEHMRKAIKNSTSSVASSKPKKLIMDGQTEGWTDRLTNR